MKGITHMVIFRLKHSKGSPQEKAFLEDSETLLKPIPGVKNFQVLKQVSPNNDFDFGLAMEFDNKDSYEKYSKHPVHMDYVNQRWFKEVEGYLEIDFESL